MSKGSGRRRSDVSKKTFDANYDKIYGEGATRQEPIKDAEAEGHWATDTGHCAPGCPKCPVPERQDQPYFERTK